MARLLIVDDDQSTRRTLSSIFTGMGHSVEMLADGQDAAVRLTSPHDIDLVLLDLGLPGMDGLDLLKKLEDDPNPMPPVVVISARGDMRSTVKAMQLGAYDYLHKPLDLVQLRTVVGRALEEQDARQRLLVLHDTQSDPPPEATLIGRSQVMHAVFKAIGQVSRSRATVLITGESGTGKELVARAIHNESASSDKPFVAINCGAIPRDLLESELFGHVKGAFTGAIADKVGRLKLAEHGTVLLDEIGDLAPEMQVKLLRVLQERVFEPVGDTKPIAFNARVLAATHRDLAKDVASGKFREDLYYRLRVVEIHLPPLRERPGDIPLLVEYLLRRVARDVGKPVRYATAEAITALTNYSWPGNVRELQNVLSRAVVLAPGDVITMDVLPPSVAYQQEGDDSDDFGADEVSTEDANRPGSLSDLEKKHILEVLEKTGWRRQETATILGISRRTLLRKIQDYDLKPRGT